MRGQVFFNVRVDLREHAQELIATVSTSVSLAREGWDAARTDTDEVRALSLPGVGGGRHARACVATAAGAGQGTAAECDGFAALWERGHSEGFACLTASSIIDTEL
ncbi:hypothetical protein B0H11DRAFT_1907343 [Mycena galericulata]|nr:hypothetical protein B0H11DRAFT_1907343 [Mycena galericulata]